MLFNSYAFLLVFLPIAFAGYYALAHFANATAAKIWLAVASFVFYGWWKPAFVLILLVSIAFNYSTGYFLTKTEDRAGRQKALLILGIAVNLSVLAYYKYLFHVLDFLALHGLVGQEFDQVVLPLGISFFTFTQIGYLVDCQEGMVRERSLLNYVLFVTFFPHLIAGPILHHREIMPQFADAATYRLNARNVATGLTLFGFGLVKKVLLADSIAPWADSGFAHPGDLGVLQAWSSVLAYSMQLYFDFCGYSDMAIGLAAMFGVRFPLNFNSPYKATSIIDFWQRWHMTLTRYLTLLLYNPVSLWVTRKRMAKGLSAGRRANEELGGFLELVALPTFLTFLLAGIWHGAGVQFVIWGLLHALYIAVNHAWRIFGPKVSPAAPSTSLFALRHVWRVVLTYLCVVVGQVFFRAASLGDALKMLAGMTGVHGSGLPLPVAAWRFLRFEGLRESLIQHGFIALVPSTRPWETVTLPLFKNSLLVIGLGVIAWGAPNSIQMLGKWSPALQKVREIAWKRLEWQPNLAWAAGLGLVLCYVLTQLGTPGRFLYFQF